MYLELTPYLIQLAIPIFYLKFNTRYLIPLHHFIRKNNNGHNKLLYYTYYE